MQVKIIIRDGNPMSVLSDGEAEVEIVSIDKDYPDYEQLCGYAEELYSDPSLHDCSFTVANFQEETE